MGVTRILDRTIHRVGRHLDRLERIARILEQDRAWLERALVEAKQQARATYVPRQPERLRVLLRWLSAAGAQPASAIAAALGSRDSAIRPLLARLERVGLVAREAQIRDGVARVYWRALASDPDVVWNPSLERAGQVPGLSGVSGASSLHGASLGAPPDEEEPEAADPPDPA